MIEQPTIAIDFDGTLCEHRYPECGPPRPAVVEAVRALHAMGWRVVVQSCRAQADDGLLVEMAAWLAEHGVPCDEIWRGAGKPFAHAYLDDRGVAVPAGENIAAKDIVVACLRLQREADMHHNIPTEVTVT
jgi:hypothetical protein